MGARAELPESRDPHRWTPIILVAALASACSSGSDDIDSGVDAGAAATADPYDGLRGTRLGEIACGGEPCCLTRCWGNHDEVCATRDTAHIIENLRAPLPDGCRDLIMPEWFYANDCYVGTTGTVGPGHPSAAGQALTYTNTYQAESRQVRLFVQCFCGRSGGLYTSEASSDHLFIWNGCRAALTNGIEVDQGLFACANECNPCSPRCGGRACGPDGCGGTCGAPCTAGTTCNAAGQCVSEAGGGTCSSCLSTCRGLPGCCTGCGCLCEDECGQCF